MRTITWRHCVLLVCVLWSGANQASTLSISGRQDLTKEPLLSLPLKSNDIVLLPGGNLALLANENLRPAAVELIGGTIELQSPQAIETEGSVLSTQLFPLPNPNGPVFSAIHWTSGMTRIGDYFDIEVVAHSPLTNANIDELILGFGFNAELSGTGEAQFLGGSVNPLFTDISAQAGVNLSAAGLAFPGLSFADVGSLLSLAVLHFQALTAGDLHIAIGSDLNDFNQGLIYLAQAPLTIQANNTLTITAVPLPPSAILFASTGLLTLIVRRKRSV